jgi:hypothetical protein
MFRRSVFTMADMAALPAYSLAADAINANRASTPAYAQAGSTRTAATQVASKSYAQELVERTAARHLELLQLDIHATPPGSSVSVIIAAKDAARIGKQSDKDDIEVSKTGTPFVEINRSGDQNVEVHLPLRDVSRRTIGEVEMTFPYPSGSGLDEDALTRAGEVIRDEMARRILDLPSLVDPVRTCKSMRQVLASRRSCHCRTPLATLWER